MLVIVGAAGQQQSSDELVLHAEPGYVQHRHAVELGRPRPSPKQPRSSARCPPPNPA